MRSNWHVTGLIATGLFFTGITYASTLNYGAIVGIDTLGIPSATYAVLLMASSIVGAAASVTLGWASDRIEDRRILVIACAICGAVAFGLIFFIRTQLAFIIAICVVLPFGFATFSQSFSFARSFHDARFPERAEFLNSILRTIFAVAWAIVPPFVGWIAATTSVFNVYGVAAAAYVAVALIYLVILRNPEARIGAPARKDGRPASPTSKAHIEPVILVGIIGCTLISMATYVNNVAAPLLITVTLKGSFAELGIWAGLAAALELPFMVLWGYALRWVKKHTIIVIAGLLYALYLLLLAHATTVTDVLWLQLINGPATAALMSIPISYMQDAIRGRVGLSTSLLDVVGVISALTSAAIFGALTATGPHYPLLFVVAAGLAAAGAVILFTTHRVLRTGPLPAG
jgi:predicted MFS family arabinose efflux permease